MFVDIRRMTICGWLFMALLQAAVVFGEQIDLKSGKKVNGRVIAKTEEGVKVDTGLKIWRIPFKMMTPQSADKWKEKDDFLPAPAAPDAEPAATVPRPGLILPHNIQQQEISAAEIVQQVKAAYQQLGTLQYESLQRTAFDNKDYENNAVHFSLVKLKRSNKYIIQEHTLEANGQILLSVFWNNGISPSVYTERTQEYWNVPGENFLNSFPVYSTVIPGLFYEQPEILARLQASVYAGSADLEGVGCHLLVHNKSATKADTYWISQTSFLVLMVDSIDQGLGEDMDSRYLTAEQLARILQSQGLDLDSDNEKVLIEALLAQEEFLENYLNYLRKKKHVQVYINDIRVDEEISAQEFTFPLPQEAVFVQSTDIRSVVDNAQENYPSNK